MTEKKSSHVKLKRETYEWLLDAMEDYKGLIEASDEMAVYLETQRYYEYEAKRWFMGWTVARIAEIEGTKRTTLTTQMQELKTKVQKWKEEGKISDELELTIKKRALGKIAADFYLLDNISCSDLILINIYRSQEARDNFSQNPLWKDKIPEIMKLNIDGIYHS